MQVVSITLGQQTVSYHSISEQNLTQGKNEAKSMEGGVQGKNPIPTAFSTTIESWSRKTNLVLYLCVTDLGSTSSSSLGTRLIPELEPGLNQQLGTIFSLSGIPELAGVAIGFRGGTEDRISRREVNIIISKDRSIGMCAPTL